MSRLIRKSNAFIFTVILQILCFLQICSLIHFHHIHSEGEFQIIVSVHPVNQHNPNHNDHHSDDHQHSEGVHSDIDPTFLRPTPRIVTELPTKLYLTASLVIQNKPDFSCIIQNFYSDRSQQKVFFPSVSPRSPPYLS